MAAPVLIPDDRTVYRGMRNHNWVKHGTVTFRAFMLRPSTDRYPMEEELSLGLTPESAVDELTENFGIAELSVLEIHHLPHNLIVRPDPRNANKAELLGLPLFSTDPAQRELALSMAMDLANVARLLPTAPVQ